MTEDLWTLRYRPDTLDGMAGNAGAVDVLKKLIASGNLPHLVFHGPENSGKASAGFALGRILYADSFEGNFTYFNASDFFDRGKEYLVRDKRFYHILGTDDPKKIRSSVISIFKTVVNEFAGMGSIDADFKIIFIDCAQALNRDAQNALRRIMEKYTRTCRFILSTTQPSRLISPLRSRGLEVFFSYVSDEELIDYMKEIATKEGVLVSDDGFKALAHYAAGNISRALLSLQFASIEYPGEEITSNILYEESLREGSGNVFSLNERALEHDVVGARKFIDSLLLEDGLTGPEVVEQLHKFLDGSNLSPPELARVVCELADTDMDLLDGSNARIHLESLVTRLY